MLKKQQFAITPVNAETYNSIMQALAASTFKHKSEAPYREEDYEDPGQIYVLNITEEELLQMLHAQQEDFNYFEI